MSDWNESEKPPTFVCEECDETCDLDEQASDYYEQTGDERAVCSWCAENSGHWEPWGYEL